MTIDTLVPDEKVHTVDNMTYSTAEGHAMNLDQACRTNRAVCNRLTREERDKLTKEAVVIIESGQPMTDKERRDFIWGIYLKARRENPFAGFLAAVEGRKK